jgi:hypothetical protein
MAAHNPCQLTISIRVQKQSLLACNFAIKQTLRNSRAPMGFIASSISVRIRGRVLQHALCDGSVTDFTQVKR